MVFANPKYWGTWQLRISYRLEENDMTVDDVNDHPQSGWLYCAAKGREIKRNVSSSAKFATRRESESETYASAH
jgi:hypothetical protein